MVQIPDEGITRPLELAAEKSGGASLGTHDWPPGPHVKIVKPSLQLASK